MKIVLSPVAMVFCWVSSRYHRIFNPELIRGLILFVLNVETKIALNVQIPFINRPAPLEYIYGSFEREESRPDQNTSGPVKQKRKSFVKSNEPVQATRYTVHNAASKDKDQVRLFFCSKDGLISEAFIFILVPSSKIFYPQTFNVKWRIVI